MKKAHTLTACALLLAALTGCGGTQEATTAEQTSETTTTAAASVTQSARAEATSSPDTSSGVQLVATNRLTGEKIATYTFHGKSEVECAGKTMLQLEFRVDAEPGTNVAPNYNILEWEGYINGLDSGESPVNLDAARCLPTEYHDVSVEPGESAEIVVILDTDGLDAIGYQDAIFEKPLTLRL